tara:strand:- start:792 stop:1046 length:255 start_codon:yes stop_codon:yes gene_type:complete
MKAEIYKILIKENIGIGKARRLSEELLNLHSVSGSFHDKDLLNAYCAGALGTLTNKKDTFLGYDHLNKIKKEAEEWKERYTNDR